MLSIIAAIGQNYELGKGGGLCFRLKGDMRFFRETTMGHAVIMGRKTFASLPGGALKGRTNYVVTRRPETLPDGVVGVSDPSELVKQYRDTQEEAFVIGGATLYEALLEDCDRLYLTEVAAECPEADVYFPRFKSENYHKTILGEGEDDGIKYTFCRYDRK